jgi:hypothetical protein
MSENRVSAQLSSEDRDAVLQAIQTIRQKLPFLIDLSPEERQTLPKIGDKSRAFVSKALQVAQQNPDFLPRSFDIEEMRRDVELFESLYPIWQSLTQLCELVEDTKIAVGSEAYVAALLIYNYGRNGGLTTGLDVVMDELGKRFARRSRSSEEASN